MSLEEEWHRACEQVNLDSENLDLWEPLVTITEALFVDENSAPITSTQVSFPLARATVFDRLLTKFPLLFGYWAKYANLVEKVLGVREAQLVWEQSVAAFPVSVDLWTEYLKFVLRNRSNSSGFTEPVIRNLFRRGTCMIGSDFLGHDFWDLYLEFETESSRNQAMLLKKLVQYPLHQYARYYEHLIRLCETLEPSDVYEEGEIDAEHLQSKESLCLYHGNQFTKIQKMTTDRWEYESKITRNYFHVIPLESDQIQNWNNYLDFEESQGIHHLTKTLYQKCLVPCAFYTEFWFRYLRWSVRQGETEEEIRNIYRRACMMYVPISRPHIRLHAALFEESLGNWKQARDILTAIPEDIEVLEWRLAFEKRAAGGDALKVLQYIDGLLNSDTTKEMALNGQKPKAELVTMKAVLQAKHLANPDAARSIYKAAAPNCLDSSFLWTNFFLFELEQVRSGNSPVANLHNVWESIKVHSRLPPWLIDDLSRIYEDYLMLECNEPDTLDKYFAVSLETSGPFSVKKLLKAALAADGQAETTNKRLKDERGHPGITMDCYPPGSSPFVKYIADQA